MSRCGRVFVLLLSVLLSTLALADDGRIPIWEPTTIDAAGAYILTRDVVAPSFTPALTIAATDVDLDLNGFKLESPGTNSNPVVVIEAGFTHITIKNGAIRTGGYGILLQDGTHREIVLENLVFQNGDRSIYLGAGECNLCRIVHNVIRSSDKQAIEIAGGAGIAIVDNEIASSGNIGIHVGPGGRGLRIVGNSVGTGNVGGAAILFDGSSSLIADNVVYECAAWGIRILSGTSNHILRNTVDGCTNAALQVGSGFSHVEGNLLIGSGTGLWLVSDDNVYRGNTTRNNATDFQDSGTGSHTHGDNYDATGAY